MSSATDIAKISVSGRAVKLLGRSLYSSHPMVILIREMLQNSRDAANEKGVKPEIRFQIKLYKDDEGNRRFEVTGTDNGTGMTPEIVLGKFLTLGDTSKSAENGNVGGLGIAAASILSADEWLLETLNYSISSTDLNEKPIQVHDEVIVNGTRIVAKFDDGWYNYHLQNIVRMLAFSAIETQLQVQLNGEVVYDHTLGGVDISEWTVLEEKDQYVVYGTPEPVEAPVGTVDSSIGGRFTGESFVRIGGLVQFREGSHGQRDSNILIDLVNLPEAGTDEYPLSLSREELRDNVNTAVQQILRAHNSNPLTSMSVIRNPEADFTILDGEFLSGLAEEEWMIQQADRSESRKSDGTPQPRAWVESAFQIQASITDDKGKTPFRIQTILKDYKYKEVPGLHWRLLLLWAEIVRIVAPDNEEFGVGLTTGDNEASRITMHGDVYYVINPSAVKGFRGNALITRLFFLAVHEVAHLMYPDHSERFTTHEQELVVKTCQDLESSRSRLMKVFNQKSEPSWLVTPKVEVKENRLL